MGASSGIGAGTAVLFSELGAHVILTGRNEENLKQTYDQCKACSRNNPFVIKADLTKDDDVQRLVDKTIAIKDRLDVLVNNAGILEYGSIETTDMDSFDRVYNLNVRSVYHLSMLCVPHLVNTQGCIVNVSSVKGFRACSNALAYCMSKSAIDQMTRCIALELAPKNVRVNCVNPGIIITQIHRRAGMSNEEYAKFLQMCRRTHALGRPGDIHEVASVIAFLASDSASFLTGTTIPVDGGKSIMTPI